MELSWYYLNRNFLPFLLFGFMIQLREKCHLFMSALEKRVFMPLSLVEPIRYQKMANLEQIGKKSKA